MELLDSSWVENKLCRLPNANMVEENLVVEIVVEVKYVYIIGGKQYVKNAVVKAYVHIIGKNPAVKSVKGVRFVYMIK